jgi:hypothetical protein
MYTKLVKTGIAFLTVVTAMALSVEAQQLFQGDGSNEAGFVPPPPRKEIPPPPANVAGGETFIPYPPPPATPMSRSEKKNPPKPPTMFTKLTSQHGEQDWNARPNDLNNLLKSLKSMADVDYEFEAKSFAEIDVDPDMNPILYRSGHYHWSLSAEEKAKLREFLLKGGTIVLNAGMGSKPFYDSARKVLNEVFPEAPVQRLSADHPIFHSYYELDKVGYRPGVRALHKGNDAWLEGVTIDCRTVAIISRFGMEVGWDPLEDDNIIAYTPESAQQLGMNIMTYATAMRTWMVENVKKTKYEDAKQVSTAGSMNIAQIMYGEDGGWKTRHTGLSVLLQQYNQKTGAPVKFSTKEMRLTDPALMDSPIIYFTGHEAFTLKPEEITALRNYLNSGGLLIAEACCGRKAFDASFREMMAKVLPGTPFNALRQGHSLFKIPNDITSLKITPALQKTYNNAPAIGPDIRTLEVDGHTAVIYSPIGMAGAWELSPNKYCGSYLEDDAIRLGVNILIYAATR